MVLKGVSKVHHESGLGTWLACGGICLFGCWAGCCLIPFCLDDLRVSFGIIMINLKILYQDTVHKCENCNKLIRVKKLIS